MNVKLKINLITQSKMFGSKFQDTIKKKPHRHSTQSKSTTEADQIQDKIFMNRTQLVEFTKKFALDKLEFQEQIQHLKDQVKQKNSKISLLQEQVKELLESKTHLQNTIQKMGENQKKEMQTKRVKYCESKSEEREQLTREVERLKQHLEYEKKESNRYRQFLKIKEEIIHNLQWEKNQIQNKTPRKIQNNFHFSPKPKSKTIIIKKKQKENLSKTNVEELQEQRKKNLHLQSENQLLKKECEKMKEEKGEEKEKEVLKKKIIKTYTTNEKLLAEKCTFLQRHIEKLTKKIKEIEEHGEVRCECNRFSEESFVEQKILVNNFSRDSHR